MKPLDLEEIKKRIDRGFFEGELNEFNFEGAAALIEEIERLQSEIVRLRIVLAERTP